jgi:HK97 family phage major capsid protein
MNKELRELLNQINAKKVEARNLATQNKIDEAKAAKEELIKLQDKFDVMKDLYDEEEEEMEDQAANDTAKAANEKKPNFINAFINVFKATVLKKTASAKDVEILNQMNEADPTAGVSDGGLTVPKDLRTQIKELRRSEDALETLVNVEPVSTLSGSRVIEVNADEVPFDNVEEAADFPECATPQFENIEYKVKKKGGILKVTRELLQDTAENILGYLKKWIVKKAKATRNFLILSQLNTSFGGAKTVAVDSFDDFKDIFNVSLDPAIALSSIVLTNQNGFNWLDKLKNTDGDYILEKNPVNATQKLLFGKYPVKVVKNKVLASTIVGPVEAPTGYKHPFYCGDLKEAITIFDRESLSVEFSTEAGDLWQKDLTGVKVRERLDIKTVDEEAVIKAEVTVTV